MEWMKDSDVSVLRGCLVSSLLFVLVLYLPGVTVEGGRDFRTSIVRRVVAQSVVVVVVVMITGNFRIGPVWTGFRDGAVAWILLYLGPLTEAGATRVDGLWGRYWGPGQCGGDDERGRDQDTGARLCSHRGGMWAFGRDVIAAPILEESLFRGCLTEGWVRCGAAGDKAVMVPAALFSLLHAHHFVRVRRELDGETKAAMVVIATQMGFALLFGAFSGRLYVKSGSLTASIVAHALCNWWGPPPLHWSSSEVRGWRLYLSALIFALTWSGPLFCVCWIEGLQG